MFQDSLQICWLKQPEEQVANLLRGHDRNGMRMENGIQGTVWPAEQFAHEKGSKQSRAFSVAADRWMKEAGRRDVKCVVTAHGIGACDNHLHDPGEGCNISRRAAAEKSKAELSIRRELGMTAKSVKNISP